MAAPIFYLVSVLLFPVTLVGYVIWVGKALMTGRGSGVSGTAQGPLSARWFCHNLGTRKDEAANRLMLVVPGISPLAVRMVAGPMMLAHRITGFVPRAFRYPFEGEVPIQYQASARQTFFDRAAEQYLDGVPQCVILGAGFDTRAYREPVRPVTYFEIDTPRTQAVKREMLGKAGLDSKRAVFVPADFEKDDWFRQLVAAGFDAARPALFLWEGVMVYLEEAAVHATFERIARTARGSAVAFDYFTTDPLESNGLYWRFARAATQASGEPLKFGIDSTPPSRDRLEEFLRPLGLTLAEQRTLGSEAGGGRSWGGFAIATVR